MVEELLRRQQAGECPVLDDLVADDVLNHAAGLQGRSGLARILSIIDHDLRPVTVDRGARLVGRQQRHVVAASASSTPSMPPTAPAPRIAI